MYRLEVLSPVAQLRGDLRKGPSLSKRPPTLEGKTVGLLWGGSVNGDVALKRVGELLGARSRDVKTNFYVGAHPVPRPVLEKAIAECDVIIQAAGD